MTWRSSVWDTTSVEVSCVCARHVSLLPPAVMKGAKLLRCHRQFTLLSQTSSTTRPPSGPPTDAEAAHFPLPPLLSLPSAARDFSPVNSGHVSFIEREEIPPALVGMCQQRRLPLSPASVLSEREENLPSPRKAVGSVSKIRTMSAVVGALGRRRRRRVLFLSSS